MAGIEDGIEKVAFGVHEL